jgi:hypothetical protein
MKLPLSETEKLAISEAHEKAKKSAAVCAKYIGILLQVLADTSASIDKETFNQISEGVEKAESALFRIRMQEVKIRNTGLEGRGFKAES